MNHETFEAQLQSQFTAEDAELEGAAFIQTIDRQLDRQRRYRKAVLAGCGVLGGALAIIQVPGLLGKISPSASDISGSLTGSLQQTASTIVADPVLLGIAAACTLTVFLLTAFERA